MRKFIVKTFYFVFPFIILYGIAKVFYSSNEAPDLIRLGYIPNIFEDYSQTFKKEQNRKIYYKELSTSKKYSAKILTIGDSFSEQGNLGYKNYLAEKFTVLHVNRFISKNPIETLFALSNGDFFSRYKIEYVVLENVERNFLSNIESLDVSKTITVEKLDSIISSYRKPIEEKDELLFFSKRTVAFPISMGRYFLKKNYLSNGSVYNVNLITNKLFSNNSNKLFFIRHDTLPLENNNNFDKIKKMNEVLNNLSNKLSSKNVKLIVLPAPDKYDLYYEYIADKTTFKKPLFFSHLDTLRKHYFYINSKKVLSNEMKVRQDIYYFGDTHWSPNASKIISKEIEKVIVANK